MADINEFTSPDPQETSRSLEALKALTTEILTLRTTMRNQAKEIDKMSAAEVVARQEQISKMESLVEAQKIAIRMAEDEALALGASGKATEDLIATVIKQTSLANRSQSLIEQELSSRNALNQRLERATREEESRRARGAKIGASPTSLRAVADQANADTGKRVEEKKKFSDAFEEAMMRVFANPIELLRRISDNLELLVMEGIKVEPTEPPSPPKPDQAAEGDAAATEAKKGPLKTFSDLMALLLGKLSDRLEKIIPGFKVFSDQVKLANQRYDKFIDSLKKGYEKFKELFTLSGMFSFLMRVIGVSLILVGTGLFKLTKKLLDITGVSSLFSNTFRKVKSAFTDFDPKKTMDRIGVAFNRGAKFLDRFSEGLANTSLKVSVGIAKFGAELAKDPIGILKKGFMGGMNLINKGVTKAFDGLSKFGDGAFKFAGKMFESMTKFFKGIGSSIAAFSKSVMSFIGPLVTGISRFVLSLIMATAQIIFSAIQLGAGLLAGIISFLVPIGAAILTFVGSVLMGAFTFVASLVVAAVTFIGGLVAALTPIILPALLIVAVLALVIYGLYLAYKKFEWFRNMVNTVGQTISDVFGYLSDFFNKYVFDPIKSAITAVIKGITAAIDYMADWLPGLESTTEKQERLQEEYESAKAEEKERLRNQSGIQSRERLEFREKQLTAQYAGAKDEEEKNIILAKITAVREELARKPKVQTGPGQLSIPAGGAGGAGRAQVTVINNATPVVTGGGGGGQQVPQYVAPARSPNDTLRDLQGANIPRG